MYQMLIRLFTISLKTIQSHFRSKNDLLLENIAEPGSDYQSKGVNISAVSEKRDLRPRKERPVFPLFAKIVL